jgi:hypothetical protein
MDPVFRTEILFNTTCSSMELGTTASGNEHFIQHLTDTFARVQKESGLSVKVWKFHGVCGEPVQSLSSMTRKPIMCVHMSATIVLLQWSSSADHRPRGASKSVAV